MEKTQWTTTIIVFLGMLLNSTEQVICIPVEKKDKSLKPLMLQAKRTTVLKIQQLLGLLNFLSKAIFPAHGNTRRYYSKTIGLKQYHHVRIDKEMKDDTRMWMTFLSSDYSVNRPFVDFKKRIDAQDIGFIQIPQDPKQKEGQADFLMDNGFMQNGTTNLWTNTTLA